MSTEGSLRSAGQDSTAKIADNLTMTARRIADGLSKLEAIRCLKRYIAREVFNLITKRNREINQTQIAA